MRDALPLAYDSLTAWTLAHVNTPLLANPGTLDADGNGAGTLNLPPELLAPGLTLHFAAVLFTVPDGWAFAATVPAAAEIL